MSKKSRKKSGKKTGKKTESNKRRKVVIASLAAGGAIIAALGLFFLFLFNGDAGIFKKGTQAGKSMPNIIFVMIDTLSIEHCSFYGYERKTTPHMDWMASKGIFFDNVIASSPWTKPAVTTILTGNYASNYFPAVENRIRYTMFLLPDKAVTLPMVLKDRGYRTIGFADNPINGSKWGYDKGFDVFVDTYRLEEKNLRGSGVKNELGLTGYLGVKSKALLDMAEEKVGQDEGSPFFLWLHIIYPHEKYKPPRQYVEKFLRNKDSYENKSPWQTVEPLFNKGVFEPVNTVPENKKLLVDYYDAEVNYTDDFIKNLYDIYGDKTAGRPNLWVITSDHGEAFYRHNFRGHGQTYYNELLQVPLIMYSPKLFKQPRRFSQRVRLADIAPTIMNILSLQSPVRMTGKSLMPIMRGVEKKDREVYSEHALHKQTYNGMAMYSGKWKFMRYGVPYGEKVLLFNMDKDRTEQKNVYREHLKVASHINMMLTRFRKKSSKLRKSAPSSMPMDQVERDRLEALGYMGD